MKRPDSAQDTHGADLLEDTSEPANMDGAKYGPPADPLLACLEQVAATHGMEVCRDAVLAGLPLVNGRLTPGLLLRAAQRAGFRARLVERSVRWLPRSVLPAILLLHGNTAGVLSAAGRWRAVEFQIPGCTETTGVELKRDYTGFAILLQPHVADVEDRRPSPRMWFWHTMWKFREYYLRLVPAAFLISLLALVMPIFTMLVYDRVVPNDAVETLWVLSLGVIGIFFFEYLLRLLRGSVLERAGREMDMVLASTLYEQLLSLEMQARPPSASILAARSKSYDVLRDFFMSATMLAVVDLPFSMMMIGVLFFIGGPLGWVVVLASLTAIIMGLMFQIPLRRAVQNSSESAVERQAMVSETINGLETVKGAHAEGALQHRFETMIGSASHKDVEMHWYSLLGTSSTGTLMSLTTVAVLVAAVFRVKGGEMTMGGMIACMMLASRTMMPIAMVAGLMTRMQQALQALQCLNGIMALPRETGGHRKFVQRSVFEFNYVLEDVTISYPGQQMPALNKVSLQINQGQRVALLGRIGSGKTTLLRLLAKLYMPTEGRVLLDNVDLAQYHPAVVRHDIGYLAQDATVFSGTIRENVALGARWVSDDEVIVALRLAGLEDYVKKNPKGIHATVGEQGSLLSGGQRRALVLARSLLSNPRLLLLDEPVASMDPQSEREFIIALQRYLDLHPNCTLVVATHKNTMLSLVDQIIVLNEGKVFCAGEKQEVLAKLAGRPGAGRPATADVAGSAVEVQLSPQVHVQPAKPVASTFRIPSHTTPQAS